MKADIELPKSPKTVVARFSQDEWEALQFILLALRDGHSLADFSYWGPISKGIVNFIESFNP